MTDTRETTPAIPEIVIRWRRYGRTGGKWRAEFPPGNGIDSGYVESFSLDTVEYAAAVVAQRYNYRIVREDADVALGEQL